MANLPTQARVVIIGGGIIGTSIAYHLGRMGCSDVLLLERDRLTSGTTWHAAGLLTTAGQHSETGLWAAQTSIRLYNALEQETGLATGVKACGFLQLASTPERLELLRREAAFQRMHGVEKHEMSPAELRSRYPMLKSDDLTGGFLTPGDGRVNPVDATASLAAGARRFGVRIVEGVPVTNVLAQNGRATGVDTPFGPVAAEIVVNAAGMWARQIAAGVGVALPLQAAEHYYLLTDPMNEVRGDFPAMEDSDRYAYYREEVGGMLVGLFEPEGAVWSPGRIPGDASFTELPPDMDRIAPFLETAFERIPALQNAGIRKLFCGPESFTPDGAPLLGETPELRNFYVAAGLNSIGILSGGGIGELMADWILQGKPGQDVTGMTVSRFPPAFATPAFLSARTPEMLGAVFAKAAWPTWSPETGRGMRLSPIHREMAAAGAHFVPSSGWEVPLFFDPTQARHDLARTFARQPWFGLVEKEHLAVRQHVGMFDMSLMAKFLVEGPAALAVVDRLSTARVDVAEGRNVYTAWTNDTGGLLADLTITRLGPERFLVVSSDVIHRTTETLLRCAALAHETCIITDVTNAFALLSVQGPRSRDLLEQVSGADLSTQAVPFRSSCRICIGFAELLLVRVTYVGELGYELYVPADQAAQVYQTLAQAGEAYGLAHCGLAALSGLRIEKGYRDYGHDIDNMDTVLEAGLGFTVDLSKGAFVGKDAILAQKQEGALRRRLVHVLLDDPEPLLFHGEPILWNEDRVGYVRSGAFGHTLGASVGMGFIERAEGITGEALAAGRFAVDIAGRCVPAKLSLQPFYDPKSERVRR